MTPSGPGAFFLVCFREDLVHLVFAYLNYRCGGEGVAGGVNGCVERCSGRVWDVFFKSAIERIQIVCLLLILHSAGGWCLVGYLFQAFTH